MKRISVVIALALAGCSNTAEWLRSQPVTHFPSATAIAIPDDLKALVTLHCMKDQEVSYTDSGTNAKGRECLYVSADVSNLAKAGTDKVLRDRAINFLTSLSDLNCSNFVQRSFANRAGLDFTKSFITDMSSGASAATAHANPAIASGLSISNLIVGKGVDNFNATYYFDKTFQALESAINGERARLKANIVAHQAQTTYDLSQAIADIRAYDDACSIKAGLAQLVQIAGTQKAKDQNCKNAVELATDAQKGATLTGGAPCASSR